MSVAELIELHLYEEMVVDGAWWGYVDAVAVHRIGKKLSERGDQEHMALEFRGEDAAPR